MSATILIVGAAATGRVPMTAALLERLLEQRGLDWIIATAGVVAHDDAPAEVEARDAMMVLGLNVSAYRACSLTDELVAAATVLLAVDSGMARVIHARYSDAIARTTTLGELAGRARDIPDPFRMQIGAWITYAREIESLLKTGLDRLVERTRIAAGSPAHNTDSSGAELLSPRQLALARCAHILALLHSQPSDEVWAEARPQLVREVTAASAMPLQPSDLAVAYGALLNALLSMTSAPPTLGQVEFLTGAVNRLHSPVDQQAITDLSAQMGTWALL